MSALPEQQVEEQRGPVRPVLVAPRPPRRRRRHLAAIAAAAAYGAAAAGFVLFVLPALERDAPPSSGITAPAPAPALTSAPRELLAMRALAARAQAGVYVLEAGAGRGAGFVAWTLPRRNQTYLLTARSVVAGLLAEGGRTVYVRRGDRFWTGRLWAADKDAGMAVVRVNTTLERPLWQDDDAPGSISANRRAFIVPPGRDTPFGEARAQAGERGRFVLQPGYAPLYVGAPVVNSAGRTAGVVIAAHPRGTATVAPLEAACNKLRRCSPD